MIRINLLEPRMLYCVLSQLSRSTLVMHVHCILPTVPAQPHFRYSGSGKITNALPFQWEGLCPHHEQKVAASIMAAQISDSVQSGGNFMFGMYFTDHYILVAVLCTL